MFMETDQSRQTAEVPKEKTFESNANSIAATEQPATGGVLPLPSQEGKDRPELNFDTQHYSVANQGASAQPSAAPQQTPLPSVAPTAVPTPAGEQLAMLTTKPTPPPPQAQATAGAGTAAGIRLISRNDSRRGSPATYPIAEFRR